MMWSRMLKGEQDFNRERAENLLNVLSAEKTNGKCCVWRKEKRGSQSARNTTNFTHMRGQYVIIQSNAALLLCSIYKIDCKIIFETHQLALSFPSQSRLPLKSNTSSRAPVLLYQPFFLWFLAFSLPGFNFNYGKMVSVQKKVL
jgi:hypothetical protein